MLNGNQENRNKGDGMDLERAIEIAVQAHKGASDKGGAPYILHTDYLRGCSRRRCLSGGAKGS
jgi:(p)ppGpp synthase/HD superfamily hydrolase|tara:strand:+ start:1413 stop:1601 length:189 start_codon:yes stop_codon:yes gene_type:complete